ncbi:ABC transporter ATP-binding protein [soil metagenome]
MTESATKVNDTGTPEDALLDVRGLTTEVEARGQRFDVLRGIDLTISRGETFGVAGESGSGKTMLALSILGLLPQPQVRVTSGSVTFEGMDLVTAPAKYVRSLLGHRMSAVFQDPLTSLNPLFTVGDQIGEVLRRHGNVSRRAAATRARELLEAVHISQAEQRVRSYPHELSGGQRQRVAIAIAIANEPALLVADEPSTALDVTVQAEILDLLDELQQRMGMSILFITHDLGVVQDICDRLVVMYAGRIVEHASTDRVFASPQHPYTRRLMECVPRLGRHTEPRPIPGMPPPLNDLPQGCTFHPRCDVGEPRCQQQDVHLTGEPEHQAACIKPGARP